MQLQRNTASLTVFIAGLLSRSLGKETLLKLTRDDGRTVAATAYTPTDPCQGLALISLGDSRMNFGGRGITLQTK